MSWLRNHFRHFVLPGIHTLARANGATLVAEDIKPRDRQVRASTKCKYHEAGMLYAAVASVLRKGDPTRDVALGLYRQLGRAKDAEFVYELDLGGRGVDRRVRDLALGYDGIDGSEVLHSFIMNSVKELKKRTQKQAQAIYPGRDVWCWEVVSRRLGMPSHYDSKVSRSIATNEKAIKAAIQGWPIKDWEKTVLFDTGHAGTVPRAIGKAAGLEKMLVIMLSAVNNEEQLFKTHAKSRKKALACEYLAKYRKRAFVRDDLPYQELADLDEFIKAALLTIWLWYHISPAKVPSWKDRPVVQSKGGLRFGKSIISVGHNNTVFTPVISGGTGMTTAPFWFNTASTSSGTIDVTSSLGWGSVTTDGAGWGAATTPYINPSTFQLVDPSTGVTWLDPMDLANAQYQRRNLDSITRKMTASGPIDKSHYGSVNVLDNSPSQPTQASGGPSGGVASTPTTVKKGGLRVVPIPPIPLVTDGNGKAITI